jgi:hypothetical protein
VHMIKLTQEREITPYVWVHPAPRYRARCDVTHFRSYQQTGHMADMPKSMRLTHSGHCSEPGEARLQT